MYLKLIHLIRYLFKNLTLNIEIIRNKGSTFHGLADRATLGQLLHSLIHP